MVKPEVKKAQAELKKLVQKTFNEVKASLKKRTAIDYQIDINNTYKINSLNKLLHTFDKLAGLPKDGKLTKQTVNKVQSLEDKELSLTSKLNEKTRLQPEGTRRKKQREALGEKFKEIYIYAEMLMVLMVLILVLLRMKKHWKKKI